MARKTPVVACTRKAVSVAAPSVCIQLTSRGTLRKRKYLTPPTRPVRSSTQSSGTRAALSSCLRRADFAMSGPRDRYGIEPAFDAVHVHARIGLPVAADPRLGARTLDRADAEMLAEHEVAVHDREG